MISYPELRAVNRESSPKGSLMLRNLLLAAVVFISACGLTRAADPAPPAGFWKLTLQSKEEDIILMVAFSEQDGKWVGDYLTSSTKLGVEPSFKSLKVSGDVVQFSLQAKGQELISFDGLLSKDKKKISGSMSLPGSRLTLTDLYPTKLKKLDDPVDIVREAVNQVDGPEFFEVAFAVVSKAGTKKIPPDEVRSILDRVNKSSALYGPRWEREMTLKFAGLLAAQSDYADLAVAQAKRAERLLTDDDDAATRLAVLEAVTQALTTAGKPNDAKPYYSQIAKLETRDYAEYAKTFPFKTEPFGGRKAKSDRAVLVEVFTGAECPPCVAVDLAFDGLMKTYKPTEVILLQYHLPIPRPDPLTNADVLKRVESCYAELVDGTPTIFIGGKLGAPGGGSAAAAEKKYAGFRKVIEEGLEKPAGVKLGLTLSKGEKGAFSAKATIADLEAPGEKIMVRFALAEERIRYAGGNGLRYHHMVVRAMPGGIKGFPLTKKASDQTVTFNPDELRTTLNKFLDDFAKEEAPFPRADRPLALKNLKLVAFVQNDATKEILQAVQVDVE
jgi:thiol-disulfide isomerase/thioredoxin